MNQAEQSDADGPKAASKRGIQKTGKATGNWICNIISNKITKNSWQNNSETNLQTKNPIDIPRYILYICILYIYIIYIIYIYIQKKRQQIIDELRST